MDIDTGQIYLPDDIVDLERQLRCIEPESQSELKKTLENSVVEISESDIEKEEKETKQVRLDGNSKLAKYAREMRNMRRFVQFRKGG